MAEAGAPSCAVCGRAQEQVRKLIAAGGGPALCDECIERYRAALTQALEEDARARRGTSRLVEAEEMALDLIDALEASRARQEEQRWLERPTLSWPALQMAVPRDMEEEPTPEPPEPPPEPPEPTPEEPPEPPEPTPEEPPEPPEPTPEEPPEPPEPMPEDPPEPPGPPSPEEPKREG